LIFFPSCVTACEKEDTVEKRIFGKTGLSVSVVGFGAAPIGYLETEQQQVNQTVNALLDAGVNLIDTAAAYQGSEEALGKAVSHRRDQFILVSKCGQAFDDLAGKAWSPEVIAATVDRSLRRLRTDRLDVMLLHSCGMEVLERGDALSALVRLRDAGKIRFVGYSGDNEEGEFAARVADVAVIETSVNICDQANLRSVLPLAREHKVGVLAKRPLANTAWRPLQELSGIYQDYAKPYRDRFETMRLTPHALSFSGEGDWPEIALRFTLSQPGVHCAIVGTTKPANALRNLEYAAKGPLAKDVIQKIKSAFSQAAGAKPWPGLT
jgi:aryl-alcohol dehydrogenase-like predicted oxidoreductase